MIDQVWIAMQFDADGEASFAAVGKTLEGVKREIDDYVGLNRDDLKDNITMTWSDTARFDSEEYWVGHCVDKTFPQTYGTEFHIYKDRLLD